MPRDLRQIGANKINYPDKCYLYDSKAVQGNKLIKESQPLCRFYKRDVVPFSWKRPTINGVVSSRREYVGTVETTDKVPMIRPDMFVVDQTGMLLMVVEPIITDDENKSKSVGSRPAIKTTFTLRGLESV